MPHYVGVISGTSIDGLDLALVSITENEVQLVSGTTYPFSESLQRELVNLAHARSTDLRTLGETDAALGQFIADAIERFLSDQQIASSAVRAIGSHGQTIRHEPDLQHSFSQQIGDPNRIAEITGIDVVADFRSRDVAAGGQGAPLVPVFHDALFHQRASDLLVLNIGGISNVTILPSDENDAIRGFDTGPGNALLDAWIKESQGKRYDGDGRLSSKGEVIQPLLDYLMEDPWLQLRPPKSTGKERFNLDYVNAALAHFPAQCTADIAATLCEFTAASIRLAIYSWCCETGKVIVCGGGRRNLDLMRRLASALPNHEVQTSENAGIDGDLIEAAAFAYLAHLFFERIPGNVPEVTGARGPRVLGSLYPGS